ncbi:MAG: Glu/Leu/Phe/Val dehydrogenase, partial [Candidatus Methylomirabilales bacterium]
DARIVIQGSGNVGGTAACMCYRAGWRVVGISDRLGGRYNPGGLNIPALFTALAEGAKVSEVPDGEPTSNAELLTLPCDILIPAAVSGQLHADNAAAIQARLIVEGANGPTTPEADSILRERKVVVIPDILANAGGVTVSYFEWVQDLQFYFWKEQEIISRLHEIMIAAYRRGSQVAEAEKVDLRTGAMILAVRRVTEAHRLRGLYP